MVLRISSTFVKRTGTTYITTAPGAGSGRSSRQVQPAEWARRLGFVRGFARYRSATDRRTQIPPPGCCRTGRTVRGPTCTRTKRSPRLLAAALQLPTIWHSTPLRPWVFHCLFGLLSVTGLRIAEALNLKLARSSISSRRC